MNFYKAMTTAETEPQIQAEGAGFDLRRIQDFLARRWQMILVTAVIVCALALLLVSVLTPRYTASAQVLLDPKKDKIFGNESVLSDLSLETGSVDSQISVLRSTVLLRRAVEKANLVNDPEFGGTAQPGVVQTLLSYVGLGGAKGDAPQKADEGGVPPAVLASINKLRSVLDVQRVQRTYVLSISVTSDDPGRAARLANLVADTYVVDQLDARYDAAKRASSWLAERMETLKDQVRKSEEDVTAFRREHNLITTGGDTKVTLSDTQLSELSGKLASARADTAERMAKYKQTQQVAAGGGSLESIPDVVRSTTIGSLRQQQSEVQRREADLVARYSDSHPLVINVRAERRNVERSISAEVARIITNMKNDYDVAKAREASLQASVEQATNATGNDSEVGVQLRELERTNSANKTLFEQFLSRSKVTQEQSSFEEREARIISPASRPGAASFPQKGLIMSLALAIGLVVGTGGAVALDTLNSGFTTPAEVEDKLGVPVLAGVPQLTRAERNVDGTVLDPARYLIAKPLSRFAEAVRSARVGIQMSDVDSPPKVVLITSTVPKEGKTTLSASLAFSAAASGLKVALIDADMRHPSLSKFFELEEKLGLSDLLTGTATPEQAFVNTNGITMIPAGTRVQNPPDLLGSGRMQELVAKLRQHYDYIVIDTSPIGPVIDAKIAMRLADKVVYVVRWASTTREMVNHNLRTLTPYIGNGRRLAGVVLSLIDESKTPRYGKYSYYSGYYYRDYYSS